MLVKLYELIVLLLYIMGLSIAFGYLESLKIKANELITLKSKTLRGIFFVAIELFLVLIVIMSNYHSQGIENLWNIFTQVISNINQHIAALTLVPGLLHCTYWIIFDFSLNKFRKKPWNYISDQDEVLVETGNTALSDRVFQYHFKKNISGTIQMVVKAILFIALLLLILMPPSFLKF